MPRAIPEFKDNIVLVVPANCVSRDAVAIIRCEVLSITCAKASYHTTKNAMKPSTSRIGSKSQAVDRSTKWELSLCFLRLARARCNYASRPALPVNCVTLRRLAARPSESSMIRTLCSVTLPRLESAPRITPSLLARGTSCPGPWLVSAYVLASRPRDSANKTLVEATDARLALRWFRCGVCSSGFPSSASTDPASNGV